MRGGRINQGQGLGGREDISYNDTGLTCMLQGVARGAADFSQPTILLFYHQTKREEVRSWSCIIIQFSYFYHVSAH